MMVNLIFANGYKAFDVLFNFLFRNLRVLLQQMQNAVSFSKERRPTLATFEWLSLTSVVCSQMNLKGSVVFKVFTAKATRCVAGGGCVKEVQCSTPKHTTYTSRGGYVFNVFLDLLARVLHVFLAQMALTVSLHSEGVVTDATDVWTLTAVRS